MAKEKTKKAKSKVKEVEKTAPDFDKSKVYSIEEAVELTKDYL